MAKGGIKYHGVGDKGIPLTMKEVVLIHLQNLSFEIVSDGLGEYYEPALDRLMNWLYFEFAEHHRDMKITWKGAEQLMPVAYDECMTRDFGNTKLTDVDKARRIQDKERLLSLLLAAHRITLGQVESYEEASLPADVLKGIVPEEYREEADNGSDGEDS